MIAGDEEVGGWSGGCWEETREAVSVRRLKYEGTSTIPRPPDHLSYRYRIRTLLSAGKEGAMDGRDTISQCNTSGFAKFEENTVSLLLSLL